MIDQVTVGSVQEKHLNPPSLGLEKEENRPGIIKENIHRIYSSFKWHISYLDPVWAFVKACACPFLSASSSLSKQAKSAFSLPTETNAV